MSNIPFRKGSHGGAFYILPTFTSTVLSEKHHHGRKIEPTEETMSARHFNYFDNYKNEILECPKCHWRGTFEQGSVEQYVDQMDCACPQCDVSQSPILAVAFYPTLPELRANMDKPGVREWVERIDRGFDEFEAQKLREPSQLPDLAEGSFELVWDFDDSHHNHSRTLIKCGDVVAFSEPARYGGFPRFGEICGILKARYGDTIKDLVPTLRSENWLYGDAREARNVIEWFRLHHFGASIANQQQSHLAAKSLARNLHYYEISTQQPAQEDSQTQMALNFEPRSVQSQGQRAVGAASNVHATTRRVPGVPGARWERTEDGTSLILEPNSDFDSLSSEEQTEMIAKLLGCMEQPNHIQRATALRDAFANCISDKSQQQPNDWPSAFTKFQYGPEMPDLDGEDVSLVFDYSHDGSKFFVLFGEQIILSGLAADDPDDHVTDNAPGEQFIEIAKRLKERYGAKLVDLVPAQKAENMLTDLWGWTCKLDRGRTMVRHRDVAPPNFPKWTGYRSSNESQIEYDPSRHECRVKSELISAAT